MSSIQGELALHQIMIVQFTPKI